VERQSLLRQLPAVDRVVRSPRLDESRRRLGEAVLTRLVREAVAAARGRILEGGEGSSEEEVVCAVEAHVAAMLRQRASRVINATGVVLHTNLGRAPLSEAAAHALAESARGYSSIEIDLESGRRGARGGFAEVALAQLTGAEDALVVNNNAAAVLLALTTLARGRAVIVSRGELVEIGGGFRVPDVLERSGANMIEVGTTNRTRLGDYERAIDERDDVAAILRVHPSNFRQLGFVARAELRDLAALAHARGVVLIDDLGSGALVDLAPHGLDEPRVFDLTNQGADLICFSCDKALGGPQGGAIVGRADLVARLRRDPLARALRLGRLPLVALEATLAAYLEGDRESIPTLAMIERPREELRARVTAWQGALAARGVVSEIVETEGAVGGGAAPESPLASVALAFDGDVEALARALRVGAPAVVARIHAGRLLIDGRTVLADEDEALLDRLIALRCR
jgi:L-seryl-tRNA(Ser) seleniumtransferase